MIAISLSMDAFSLSLAYGTLDIEEKDIIILSIIIGIFHFFMPLIGIFLGSRILHILPIQPNTVVFIVLSFIGIEMIIDTFKNKEVKKMKKLESLLFGFGVSVDSFSVGLGLESITNNYLISSLLFSLSSFIFTYVGLMLGKKINKFVGILSTLIGGLVLIIIGIFYLI
jgi:putative Mn2+ efflux pump MntP